MKVKAKYYLCRILGSLSLMTSGLFLTLANYGIITNQISLSLIGFFVMGIALFGLGWEITTAGFHVKIASINTEQTEKDKQ